MKRDLYGVHRWGKEYFTVLSNGHIGLKNPMRPEDAPTDLVEVVESLSERGISSPLLLRVEEFLGYRIDLINHSFQEAIHDLEYRGTYRGVFPIKVNQQAQVIDRIVDYGRQHHFGLEVGSKPELLIALAHQLSSKAVVICNGVKDAEFIQLALLSQRLGFQTVLVLESPKELQLVLSEAERLKLRPLLGIRIKLSRKMSGKWSSSSGDRSSFGMTSSQVMEVIDELRDRGYLDCLVLQHSHLGSQLPHIIEIRHAVREACTFYAALVSEGAPLLYFDIGGGLGVDYTGEHKSNVNSINYSLQEYCANVIETIKLVLDESGVSHPIVISESGRACVAHSSMLIFNVLEVTRYDRPDEVVYSPAVDHELVTHILAVLEYLEPARLQECLHDLTYYLSELRELFKRAQLSLRQVARGEEAFFYVLSRLKEVAAQEHEVNEELQVALDNMADIYHCNFSLFQSLPDVWAIDQVHPSTPLQRLNEAPTRFGTLSDITCDSDGKIDRFVLADGVSRTLPLHSISPDESYYLGVFFVGAYQETLGDLHNLFGDTNVVTIALNHADFELLHEQEGDSISEVLSYVEYDPRSLLNDFKKIVEIAMKRQLIDARDRRALIEAYKDSMTGYTYYED